MTFQGLINKEGPKHPTRIVIPQLQRDYAQGRDDQKDVRDNFLKNIFKVLKNPCADDHIYDFVFGKSDDDNYAFYPVDGQQRLTTFFLLHIYIGKRAGQDLSFLNKNLKNGQTACNFSYETRDSSKQFCEKLLEIDPLAFSDIVTYINDQQWFNGTWQNDPTIKSMMTMLDAIHQHCKDVDFISLWTNLKEKIKFWVLPLEELKSSDALYIKMNSRGKHLTDFENFKAEVEGILSHEKKGSHVIGSFAKEIDTTWTNIFWSYRNSEYDFKFRSREDESSGKVYSDNGLDERMLAFLRNFLVLYGVRARIFRCSGDAKKEVLSDIELAKRIFRRRPQAVKALQILMNSIADESRKSHDGRLSTFFSQFFTTEDEQHRYAREKNISNSYLVNIDMDGIRNSSIDIFETFMGSPTLQQKLVGYAFFIWVMEKALGHEITVPELKDRLRILRNLIANSYLHDDANKDHIPLRETLKGVELLVRHGVTAICQNKADGFAGPQKNQELQKSNAMTPGSGLQLLIPQLENHSMLRGNLSQLMPVDIAVLSKFRDIFALDCNLDEIESALLPFGDYSRKDGQRRMYGGRYEIRWRDYLMQNANTHTGPILKNALSDPAFTKANLQNLVKQYASYCKQALSFDWRYYLSVYWDMRDIPQGVYRIGDGLSYSYLMCNASGKLQGNEKSWNPYNYTLSTRFPDSTLGNWQCRLGIGDYSVDVTENSVDIYNDERLLCQVEIPQVNNVDSVDRIEFISKFLPLLEKVPSRCICRWLRRYPAIIDSCPGKVTVFERNNEEPE